MPADIDVVEKHVTKSKSIVSDLKKWNVVFYNDNVTTVEFVIFVLKEVFNYDDQTAIELTYEIHNEGKKVVGTYTYEIAEQKASDTLYLAYQYGYPLEVKIYKS